MGKIFTEVGSALARLIAVLMILCLVAPRAAVAQQTASVSHIGLLAIDTESHSREWLETFRASLRDFGYVEGKNLVIEYRWAEGLYLGPRPNPAFERTSPPARWLRSPLARAGRRST